MKLKWVHSIRDEVFRNNETKDIVFDRIAEEFSKRVDKKTGMYSIYNKNIKTQCWTYNKNNNRERYILGFVSIKELGICIQLGIHVLSMYLYKGYIPLSKNLEVRHLCNNRCCCNPDHLEIGTESRNTFDCFLHRLHCKAKINGYLNDFDFIENIRWLYWGMGYNVSQIKDIIYEQFNREIDTKYINHVVNFDNWIVTEF
jgi:hypothetical protein